MLLQVKYECLLYGSCCCYQGAAAGGGADKAAKTDEFDIDIEAEARGHKVKHMHC